MLNRGNVSVENRSEAKKQNEPGKRNFRCARSFGFRAHFGFAALKRGCGKRERNDPEGAGQFYRGADDQGFLTVLCGGADDGACVMNRERCPEAKLRLREMKHPANRWKNQERDGI